jgi:hypothetical protein
MKIALAALAAASICVASTSGSFALEIQCADHGLILNMLKKKYGEDPVAVGTVNQDRFMQIFVSQKGTWSVVVTKTDGNACIVAAGKNWEALPQLAEAEPAA